MLFIYSIHIHHYIHTYISLPPIIRHPTIPSWMDTPMKVVRYVYSHIQSFYYKCTHIGCLFSEYNVSEYHFSVPTNVLYIDIGVQRRRPSATPFFCVSAFSCLLY